jgi:hypothetical protein
MGGSRQMAHTSPSSPPMMEGSPRPEDEKGSASGRLKWIEHRALSSEMESIFLIPEHCIAAEARLLNVGAYSARPRFPGAGFRVSSWDATHAVACWVKLDGTALTRSVRSLISLILPINHCIVLMASFRPPQPRAAHLTDPVTSRDLYGTVRGACSCNACGRYIIYTKQRYTAAHQENSKVRFNPFLGPSN